MTFAIAPPSIGGLKTVVRLARLFSGGGRHPAELSPYPSELGFDIGIAPVQMAKAMEGGFALSGQTGNHQRCRSP